MKRQSPSWMMKVGAHSETMTDFMCACNVILFTIDMLWLVIYVKLYPKSKAHYYVCTCTGATVTIVSSDYMVDESQSSVEVCTSLTDIPDGGLECDVVATINTSDGPKASMSLVDTKLISGYWHL